ncbi:MAG: AraC family transcriptional regulator [Pirellulales bacterium]
MATTSERRNARTVGGLTMNNVQLSVYPHYSWLAHWLSARPPYVFVRYECQQINHLLLLTTDGDADFVWATDKTEMHFSATAGDIGFFPCDYTTHAVSITTLAHYQAYVLCLPEAHLRGIRDSEDMRPGNNHQAIPLFRDTLMRASLLRLSGGGGNRQISEDIGDEIAARQIIMRLCVLTGSSEPDWQKDTSVFSPCVMREIVERVDAHLGVHQSLEQVSSGFGLSPSHFARKFRQSAGMSLNRFINRRRLGIAFGLLRLGKVPLAQLSLDLGFSSQSHFTRLFSRLSGLTPHQFRLLHQRMGA